eukprot:12035278-Alexandrium_andersonii.AAC.1
MWLACDPVHGLAQLAARQLRQGHRARPEEVQGAAEQEQEGLRAASMPAAELLAIGCYIAWEWPRSCDAWRLPEVQSFTE